MKPMCITRHRIKNKDVLGKEDSLWPVCPKSFGSSSFPKDFTLLSLLNSFYLVSTSPFTMPQQPSEVSRQVFLLSFYRSVKWLACGHTRQWVRSQLAKVIVSSSESLPSATISVLEYLPILFVCHFLLFHLSFSRLQQSVAQNEYMEEQQAFFSVHVTLIKRS